MALVTMTEMLRAARREKRAVGAFNVVALEAVPTFVGVFFVRFLDFYDTVDNQRVVDFVYDDVVQFQILFRRQCVSFDKVESIELISQIVFKQIGIIFISLRHGITVYRAVERDIFLRLLFREL